MIIPHEETYWNDRDDTTIVSAIRCTRRSSCSRSTTSSSSASTTTCTRSGPTSHTSARRGTSGSEPKYETAPGSHRFVIPETTLGALAARGKRRSGARALRVVGDPRAKVSRVQLGVGYATPADQRADVDVVISGEQQETDGALRQPGLRARRGDPRRYQGLDHARARDLGRGRDARDGGLDQGVRCRRCRSSW